MHPLRAAATAALLLTVGAPLSAQSRPTVTITLSSYAFSPSPIVLRAGEPVRLLFENKAGKSHDFTATEFFAASRILSGNVRGGEVDLKGGASTAVELIPAAGIYPVHCGKFLHAGLGMKTQLLVR